ncbi:MAG TPA: hypothetical protein PLF22_12075 [Pseudomonadales bacterium]|nr:hypothetical protein [Pseudomonadales bacterium]
MLSRNVWGILLVIAATLAVILVGKFSQSPISESGGFGWDGSVYHEMAVDLAEQKPLVGPIAPFIYRVGVPWLVAEFFPQNMLDGFFCINAVFACAASLFLFLLMDGVIVSGRIKALVILLFVTHWQNPARYIAHYPAYVDPAMIAFALAGLCVLRAIRNNSVSRLLLLVLFCVITVLGTLCRETFFIVAVAALFSGNHFSAGTPLFLSFRSVLKNDAILCLPVLLSMATIAATHYAIPVSDPHNYYDTTLVWLYKKGLGQILYSAFMSFGLFIPWIIYFRRVSLRFFARNQEVACFLFGCCAIAYLGGSDTNRFFSWASPVLCLLCGAILDRIEKQGVAFWSVFSLFMVGQALANRLFLLVPDSTDKGSPVMLLTPLANHFDYSLVLPEYASVPVASTIVLQWIVVSAIFYVLLDFIKIHSEPD